MDSQTAAKDSERIPLWLLVGAAFALAFSLMWLEDRLTPATSAGVFVNGAPVVPGAAGGASDSAPRPFASALEVLKLVAAALIAVLISAVHRRLPGDKPLTRSLAQAQILLCVAGALMMIIIGNSFARALGVAGGATIVRFRTNVEDPKDSTVLLLLLGLGMACGIGELGVAGLGTAFLCLCLVLLEKIVGRKPRTMMLEMDAAGHRFPTEYVNRILGAYQIRFESREVTQHAQKTTVRYHCTLDPDTPLQRLSDQLTDAEADGLKSVSWETVKKE